MRIAVIGAGGTGGFFGGLLARAGENVTFLARGATLEAIRAHGLTVKSRLVGEFTVRAGATDDPGDVGPVDLVLFCVKAYDTRPAAEMIGPLIHSETAILSVQNGIDNAERIAETLGRSAALVAIALVSSAIESPGVVAHVAGGRIVLGDLRDGRDPRLQRFHEIFERAGIGTEIREDIRAALWEKFVVICGLSGMTTLTRLPLGPILADPESSAMLKGTMAEVERVAHAEGVPIAVGYADRASERMAAWEPRMYGSMYHDLAEGRRLELDTLNGTVVRLGRTRGIATPCNAAIFAALRPYASGRPTLPQPQPD